MINDEAIGLDLGTTNSCIGVFRNGGVEIIPNTIGEKTTSSIVTVLDEEVLVGEETLSNLINNHDRTISEVKRLLGKKYDDEKIKDVINKLPYPIIDGGNGEIKIVVKRKGEPVEFSPMEISSFIIKKMICIAEKYLNKKINKLIITVPAYFNDSQRNLTKQAAELLGLEVTRIINEPTAAAIAYGIGKETDLYNKENIKQIQQIENKNKYILVFDLGGGTFDVSLLYFNGIQKSFEVKAVSGDNHLGGEDFDNQLCEYLLKLFCEKIEANYEDLKKEDKIIKKLKLSCESVKKILSKSNETILCISNLYKKYNMNEKITRQDFNNICQNLFDRINIPLNTVLYDAKIKNSEIDEVILIGGSTRIPKIKQIIRNYFKNSKINDLINPDEAVAYGATLQAAKILGQNNNIISEFILQDITPLSLGIGIINKSQDKEIKKLGDEMSVIIPRGKRIPTEFKKIYSTSFDNQDCALIEIFEGERKYTKDNHLLGHFTLFFEPRPAGEVNVDVTFSIDINGILKVTAIENFHGNKKEAKIINDTMTITEENMEILKEKNLKDFIGISKSKNEDPLIDIKQRLKTYLEGYENNDDEEEKYDSILNYIGEEEDYLDSMEKKSFENETLVEKYFIFVKDLFSAYLKIFKLKNQIEKGVQKDIITKIKKYLKKFSDHILGYLNILIEILKELEEIFFYDIIIYTMQLLNENGNKCLIEAKKFCKAESIMFFEESILLGKKYIENEEKLSLISQDLLSNYLKEKKISENMLEDIKSNIIILVNDPKKIGNLVSGKDTGFTAGLNILGSQEKEVEAYNYLLFTYEKALRDIQSKKDREPSEEEAYVLANIIKIDWTLLGNMKYNKYLQMAKDCEKIVEDIKLPKDKEWYKSFKKLKTKLEREAFERNEIFLCLLNTYKKQNLLLFNEIEQKKKNKMEFVKYILKNYPYNGYKEDENNKKDFFENDSKELMEYLIDEYKPENYLLVNDEEIKLKYSIFYFIYLILNDY